MAHTALKTLTLLYVVSFSGLFLLSYPFTLDVEDDHVENITLGLSFPPFNYGLEEFTAMNMEAMEISILRLAEDWAFREPSPGDYKWSSMQDRLEFCREHGYKLFLTFQSNGPDWAIDESNPRSATFKNVSQFESFLDAWFTHFADYSDVIHKLQFGNEWVSDYWFIGSAEQFTTYANSFYSIAKSYWPETPIVLGGFATGSLRAFAALYNLTDTYLDDNGNEYTGAELDTLRTSSEAITAIYRTEYVLSNTSFDMLDLHLYADYEHFGLYVDTINYLTTKLGLGEFPLVSTEFGGPNIFMETFWNGLSWAYQAQHLQACIQALDRLNISEAYYFKLVASSSSSEQHRRSGVYNEVFILKPSYYALQAANTGEMEINFLYLLLSAAPVAFVMGILRWVAIKMKRKTEQRRSNKKTN